MVSYSRRTVPRSNVQKTQYKVGTVCMVLSPQDRQTLANFTMLLVSVARQTKKEVQQSQESLSRKIGPINVGPYLIFLKSLQIFLNHLHKAYFKQNPNLLNIEALKKSLNSTTLVGL